MLNKYKNGFIDVINRNRLDPRQFEAKEYAFEVDYWYQIHVRNSSLMFSVSYSPQNLHKFRHSYSSYKPEPRSIDTSYGDIQYIYKVFEQWLQHQAKEYLDDLLIPNLWEQIGIQEPLVSSSIIATPETSLFSQEEKAQLRLGLNEFHLLIENTFRPSREQLQLIENRFNYLSEALDRLNHFDWRSILISAKFSISANFSLDSTKGEKLFDLLKSVFSHIRFLLP